MGWRDATLLEGNSLLFEFDYIAFEVEFARTENNEGCWFLNPNLTYDIFTDLSAFELTVS